MAHDANLDNWRPGTTETDKFSHLQPVVDVPPSPNHFELTNGTEMVRDLTIRPVQRVSGSLISQSERRYRNHIGWIVDGDVSAYLDAHGSREWPLPDTFSGYEDEFDRWLHEASGTLTQYGYGIGEQAAELAHRALAGKGRFAASNYTLVVSESAPAVLLGPAGSVLIKPHPINRPQRTDQHAQSIVSVPGGTLSVEENNNKVLAGIKRFAHVLRDAFGATLTGHRATPRAGRGVHSFSINGFDDAPPGVSVDGVTITPEELTILGTIYEEPADVPAYQGGIVDGFVNGTQYYCEWDGPAADMTPRSVDDHGRIVVGYDITWQSRPRSGSRKEAAVTTYWLRFAGDYQSSFILDSTHEHIDSEEVEPSGQS